MINGSVPCAARLSRSVLDWLPRWVRNPSAESDFHTVWRLNVGNSAQIYQLSVARIVGYAASPAADEASDRFAG